MTPSGQRLDGVVAWRPLPQLVHRASPGQRGRRASQLSKCDDLVHPLAREDQPVHRLGEVRGRAAPPGACQDTAAIGIERSEEHTSEFQSLMRISYAVFCLKKKRNPLTEYTHYYINNKYT